MQIEYLFGVALPIIERYEELLQRNLVPSVDPVGQPIESASWGALHVRFMLEYAHGDKSARDVLPSSGELGEWQGAANSKAYAVSAADPSF